MRRHNQVRHHPETGHIAVELPASFNGSGQKWLYVHLDHRGDVVAKGMDEADVDGWPELISYDHWSARDEWLRNEYPRSELPKESGDADGGEA